MIRGVQGGTPCSPTKPPAGPFILGGTPRRGDQHQGAPELKGDNDNDNDNDNDDERAFTLLSMPASVLLVTYTKRRVFVD